MAIAVKRGFGGKPEPKWENWFWTGTTSITVGMGSSGTLTATKSTMKIPSGAVLAYNISVNIQSSYSYSVQFKVVGTSAWTTVNAGTIPSTFVGQSVDVRVVFSNSSSSTNRTFTINSVTITK